MSKTNIEHPTSNTEHPTTTPGRTLDVRCWMFGVGCSVFISGSVHVALITFVGLQLLDVFVRLLFGFATLFRNDFTQRRVDVFGHATRIAAHEKVRAFGIEPFRASCPCRSAPAGSIL